MSQNAQVRSLFSVECAYATPATDATARGSLPNLIGQVRHDEPYPRARLRVIPGGGGLMGARNAAQAAKWAAAKWFVIDYMTAVGGGPVPAAEVYAAGAQAGFKKGQIHDARRSVKVVSKRRGYGKDSKYIWILDLSIPQGDRTPKTYAMACERPTQAYPDGRTGTPAGFVAHERAGEQPCEPCTAARAAYFLNWSGQNRGQIAKYNRYRRDVRQETIDRLKSVPCADCGGTFPPICMDFDHVGDDKSFTISRASTRSIKTVLAEIAKCEVVCANCHRVRTQQRLQAREVS